MVNRIKGFRKIQINYVSLYVIIKVFSDHVKNLWHLCCTWSVTQKPMLTWWNRVNFVFIKLFVHKTFWYFCDYHQERYGPVVLFLAFLVNWCHVSCFPLSRQLPRRKDALNSSQRLGAIVQLHSLRILAGIPSGPQGFGRVEISKVKFNFLYAHLQFTKIHRI